MSAGFLRELSEQKRRIEQLEQQTQTILQALAEAERQIKALEPKRGPGRPPNEHRQRN